MPWWSSEKPNVSEKEFKKVRGELSSQGFHRRDLDFVDQHFRGDLLERPVHDHGIQEEEISDAVEWLKSNTGKHPLTDQKIDILDKTLRGKL